mmetsp:Transcript_7755/g.21739  ORF Transcript_7755/g.21739 Transcript_7755/m.21739 type:complete len:214 (+) Transcript_7755:216-857(+)
MVPAFENTPSPFWQYVHLPNRQWWSPSGDAWHSPELDSRALLGVQNLWVHASPGSRLLIPFANVAADSATPAQVPQPWMDGWVFTTLLHFRQCASLFSHWGKHLYPQKGHSIFVRSGLPTDTEPLARERADDGRAPPATESSRESPNPSAVEPSVLVAALTVLESLKLCPGPPWGLWPASNTLTGDPMEPRRPDAGADVGLAKPALGGSEAWQ